jgi:hypothetical protein
MPLFWVVTIGCQWVMLHKLSAECIYMLNMHNMDFCMFCIFLCTGIFLHIFIAYF